jgi:hypothetical protein
MMKAFAAVVGVDRLVETRFGVEPMHLRREIMIGVRAGEERVALLLAFPR